MVYTPNRRKTDNPLPEPVKIIATGYTPNVGWTIKVSTPTFLITFTGNTWQECYKQLIDFLETS